MNPSVILDELMQSGMFQCLPSIEPIAGGAINKSFKVTEQSNQFFLKTFELNHILPINRHVLFKQQKQLADLGIAAKPIYLSQNQHFQVEEWVEHTPLARAPCTIEEKLKHLARVLWQIHQLPVVAEPLDLPNDWSVYLDQAKSPDLKYWQQKISKHKQVWLDTHKTHQALCHNDLAFAHISMSEPRRVFDWEYAALGNRFFDIAASILVNQLDAASAMTLCKYYAQLADMTYEKVYALCQQQAPIVSLTNDLWYLAANTLENTRT